MAVVGNRHVPAPLRVCPDLQERQQTEPDVGLQHAPWCLGSGLRVGPRPPSPCPQSSEWQEQDTDQAATSVRHACLATSVRHARTITSLPSQDAASSSDEHLNPDASKRGMGGSGPQILAIRCFGDRAYCLLSAGSGDLDQAARPTPRDPESCMCSCAKSWGAVSVSSSGSQAGVLLSQTHLCLGAECATRVMEAGRVGTRTSDPRHQFLTVLQMGSRLCV